MTAWYMKIGQKAERIGIKMIIAMLATDHDCMVYENKTENKANSHKYDNHNASMETQQHGT